MILLWKAWKDKAPFYKIPLYLHSSKQFVYDPTKLLKRHDILLVGYERGHQKFFCRILFHSYLIGIRSFAIGLDGTFRAATRHRNPFHARSVGITIKATLLMLVSSNDVDRP